MIPVEYVWRVYAYVCITCAQRFDGRVDGGRKGLYPSRRAKSKWILFTIYPPYVVCVGAGGGGGGCRVTPPDLGRKGTKPE